MTHVFDIEVTDTFGGEANYCWVRRYELEMPETYTDAQLVRRAKALAGWNGYRCRTDKMGDGYELRPVNGDCVVMFIQFRDH